MRGCEGSNPTSTAEVSVFFPVRQPLEHAVDDGLIDEKDNPASKVPKPRRLPRVPVAVPGAAEVWSGWVGIAQQRAGLRILPGMVMVGKTGGCRP